MPQRGKEAKGAQRWAFWCGEDHCFGCRCRPDVVDGGEIARQGGGGDFRTSLVMLTSALEWVVIWAREGLWNDASDEEKMP